MTNEHRRRVAQEAPAQCEFCEEAAGTLMPAAYRSYAGTSKRIMAENQTAILIPSLSPIKRHHFLLVPRAHVTSTIQLDSDSIRSMRMLFDQVIQPSDGVVLSFEHGIGRGLCGGCGIDHAHQHNLVLDRTETNMVREAYRLATGACLNPTPSIDESYLVLQVHDKDDAGPEYACGSFPSQYLRRLIESALGLSPTHWRDLVRKETFHLNLSLLPKVSQ